MKVFRKKCILTFALLIPIFGFSQQSEELTLDSLKIELAKFLIQKKHLKNIEAYTEKKQNIYISGIHKRGTIKTLKTGIYNFRINSSHSIAFFVIIKENTFDILDISTFNGLKSSINKLLEFSNKQEYCAEIIFDYISRLISVYYRYNKRMLKIKDKNCEFGKEPIKSIYDLNKFKLKLAEYLIKKGDIKNIDYYFENDLFLLIEKFDMYFGIREDKNVECGLYSFIFYDEEDEPNYYYVIVHEDWLDFIGKNSFENLEKFINKILDFSENHKYCYIKTIQIIENLIERHNSVSCLKHPVFDLP